MVARALSVPCAAMQREEEMRQATKCGVGVPHAGCTAPCSSTGQGKLPQNPALAAPDLQDSTQLLKKTHLFIFNTPKKKIKSSFPNLRTCDSVSDEPHDVPEDAADVSKGTKGSGAGVSPNFGGVSTLPRRLRSPRGRHPSEQGSPVLLLVPEDFGGREGEVLLADVAVVEPVQGGGFRRAPSLFLRGGCGGRQCRISPQTL